MPGKSRDETLGRFLSLVLRHKPEAAFLRLDPHGWAGVEELLAGCARAGRPLTREDLERIVREDGKQRYSFDREHRRLRANQGHSVPVELELREAIPPARLYHGTASRFLEGIRAGGITRQSRQHVHLSAELSTAWSVGARHGTPVVLPIDAAAMVREGRQFWLSENGVWLCREVPWRFVLAGEILFSGTGAVGPPGGGL